MLATGATDRAAGSRCRSEAPRGNGSARRRSRAPSARQDRLRVGDAATRRRRMRSRAERARRNQAWPTARSARRYAHATPSAHGRAWWRAGRRRRAPRARRRWRRPGGSSRCPVPAPSRIPAAKARWCRRSSIVAHQRRGIGAQRVGDAKPPHDEDRAPGSVRLPAAARGRDARCAGRRDGRRFASASSTAPRLP